MSRATIWRILDEADLKPHKSVYWLNSHDPDFRPKPRTSASCTSTPRAFYQQGRLVICSDEKTGMQILHRVSPTQPAQPGQPEKREFEYIRHGTRALISHVRGADRRGGLGPGADAHQRGLRAHVLRVAAQFRDIEAVRLGGGQPEHALEPGGLRGDGVP